MTQRKENNPWHAILAMVIIKNILPLGVQAARRDRAWWRRCRTPWRYYQTSSRHDDRNRCSRVFWFASGIIIQHKLKSPALAEIWLVRGFCRCSLLLSTIRSVTLARHISFICLIWKSQSAKRSFGMCCPTKCPRAISAAKFKQNCPTLAEIWLVRGFYVFNSEFFFFLQNSGIQSD